MIASFANKAHSCNDKCDKGLFHKAKNIKKTDAFLTSISQMSIKHDDAAGNVARLQNFKGLVDLVQFDPL